MARNRGGEDNLLQGWMGWDVCLGRVRGYGDRVL